MLLKDWIDIFTYKKEFNSIINLEPPNLYNLSQYFEYADNLIGSGETLPDAIVCANDIMALAVVSRFIEKDTACRKTLLLPASITLMSREYLIPRLLRLIRIITR